MLNGNKDTIMEYFNLIIIVLIILTFIAFTGLITQLSANSNFSSYAEGVASRHGGLTPTAQNEIMAYSNDHYGGRYKIKGCVNNDTASLDNCRQLRYGETVEFVVEGNYRLTFIDLPMKLNLRINAVSRRR